MDRISPVATFPSFWQCALVVKTVTLEDIYADPHALDSFIEAGEPVAVVRDGREVADSVPRVATENGRVTKRPQIDYRARFLNMWGPDAFGSDISVADEFAELRRERSL
jgi:hypothetical protein